MEKQLGINEIVSLEENQEEHKEEEDEEQQPTSSFTEETSNQVSASELAALQAENWLLKKKLKNTENANSSLEKLIATIIEKQHEISGEMYSLRNAQYTFDTSTHSQRDFHIMERNSLNCELHEVKVKLNTYKRELQEVRTENLQLVDSLRIANEKIYEIGMRFLEYKSKYSGGESKLTENELKPTDDGNDGNDDDDDDVDEEEEVDSDESSISDDSEETDSDDSTTTVLTD